MGDEAIVTRCITLYSVYLERFKSHRNSVLGQNVRSLVKTGTVHLLNTNYLRAFAFSCQLVIVLAIGRKVRGFRPGRGRWIFNSDKNPYSTPFVRGEVKPSAPCRKILWHVKEPAEYDRDTSLVKTTAVSRQMSHALLVAASADYYQRSLMDESGMIRTLMGTDSRSVMVAVHGTHYAIPSRNTNCKSNSNIAQRALVTWQPPM
jgi:hypothetical protein